MVKDEIDFGNEQPEGENESQSRTRQLLSRVRRLRETRSKKQIQQPGQESTTTPISQPQAEGDHAENTKTHLRERVRNTVLDLLKPIEDKQIAEIPVQEWLGKTTLLFAYLPEPVPIFNRQNQPRLPQELIPLANLDVSNTIRPELKQVITNLASQEIKIKILASDAPEIVFAQAQALGIQTDMLSKITGGELEGLEAQDRSSKVAETQIFSKLSPAQKALIVKTLHQQGEYVAMVGNDASDVPAMQQANLRIALKSGKQAAVILTDIVLLEDSLQALSSVLTAGQRLVNGVLDTFKLYLSQVFAQLLLILYMIFFSLDQFPYHPTQAGVINAFTIVIPNILLAVWSAGGKLTESEIRRRLLIFILPIAITLSLLIWAVFEIFLSMPPPVDFPPEELIKPLKITNPQIFLAQIAVVFAMLFAGWLRVLFLQPPSPFWVGGAPLRGDRRVYGLVFVSIAVYILVLIFPWLPLQEWLRITWLPSLRDYLIVAGAVAIWAILLLGIWRSGILPKIFTRIGRNDLGSHKNHRPKKI